MKYRVKKSGSRAFLKARVTKKDEDTARGYDRTASPAEVDLVAKVNKQREKKRKWKRRYKDANHKGGQLEAQIYKISKELEQARVERAQALEENMFLRNDVQELEKKPEVKPYKPSSVCEQFQQWTLEVVEDWDGQDMLDLLKALEEKTGDPKLREINTLWTREQEMKKEVQQLKEEKDRQAQTIRDYQKETRELNNQLDRLKAERDTLDKAIGTIDRARDSLKQEVQQLKEENLKLMERNKLQSTGQTPRLVKVAEAAIVLLRPPYRRGSGMVATDDGPDQERDHWNQLRDALAHAGYSWEEKP